MPWKISCSLDFFETEKYNIWFFFLHYNSCCIMEVSTVKTSNKFQYYFSNVCTSNSNLFICLWWNSNTLFLASNTGCSAEIFTLFTILNLLEKSFRSDKNLFSIKFGYTSWLYGAQISVLRNEPFAAESIFREVCLEQHRLV